MVTPNKLYPLYCTLYLCTLAHRQLHALVALSSAFVSDFLFQFYSVHFTGYNLTRAFFFQFRLEINKPFFNFVLSIGSRQKLPQHSILNMLLVARIFCFVLCSIRSWADIQPSSHFCIRLLLTLLVILIFCVSHSNL